MNAVTWGTRLFFAAQAICWGAIGIIWLREWLGRGKRDMDQAAALACKPCSGGSGWCTCPRKCGHYLCAAADTGVMTIDDEYRALLDKEAGR